MLPNLFITVSKVILYIQFWVYNRTFGKAYLLQRYSLFSQFIKGQFDLL